MQHIYTIQDKSSQNGTYVNEERLSEVKYTTYLYNTRQRQPEWYICQWREAIGGKIYNIFIQYKTKAARMVHICQWREAIGGKIYNIFVQYKTKVARMVHICQW
jgi:hypothetical protein